MKFAKGSGEGRFAHEQGTIIYSYCGFVTFVRTWLGWFLNIFDEVVVTMEWPSAMAQCITIRSFILYTQVFFVFLILFYFINA